MIYVVVSEEEYEAYTDESEDGIDRMMDLASSLSEEPYTNPKIDIIINRMQTLSVKYGREEEVKSFRALLAL